MTREEAESLLDELIATAETEARVCGDEERAAYNRTIASLRARVLAAMLSDGEPPKDSA